MKQKSKLSESKPSESKPSKSNFSTGKVLKSLFLGNSTKVVKSQERTVISPTERTKARKQRRPIERLKRTNVRNFKHLVLYIISNNK